MLAIKKKKKLSVCMHCVCWIFFLFFSMGARVFSPLFFFIVFKNFKLFKTSFKITIKISKIKIVCFAIAFLGTMGVWWDFCKWAKL